MSERAPLLVIERDPWGGPYRHLASTRVASPDELAALGKCVVVLAGPGAIDQKLVTEAFRAASRASVPLAVLAVQGEGAAAWFAALEAPNETPRTLALDGGDVVLDVKGFASASSLEAKLRSALAL
jgi:hypothetical protein